ncbi:MAG: ComEC/Rec2 family competence protein [Collinsella sp.]
MWGSQRSAAAGHASRHDCVHGVHRGRLLRSARFAWWRSHRRRLWAIAERMRLRDLRSRWPALVAVDPGCCLCDLGFRLSVASVLFIILFGPYVRHHLCALHVPAPIADALSITLVAQWATLPLTLPVFGEVSLVSPLANLLVGPAMSGLLVTGLLGTGVATISDMLAQVAGVSAQLGPSPNSPWRPPTALHAYPSFSRRCVRAFRLRSFRSGRRG